MQKDFDLSANEDTFSRTQDTSSSTALGLSNYAIGDPLKIPPSSGDLVFVPALFWPDEDCLEYNGQGWQATVVSVTQYSAFIKFQAVNKFGQEYEKIRLGWRGLRNLIPL